MPVSHKKTTPPFSLRLTTQERAQLEKAAAGLSLGEYIRLCVFDEERAPRRTRGKAPVKDHALLGQVLSDLGQSRIANNLNQLAKAANSGSLVLTPDTHTVLMAACADIRLIRDVLMKSLNINNR